MPVFHTRMLQFYQQFGKFFARQFRPLLERTGLSMRELNVLLFLVNNPEYDTARDVTVLRGLSKSQVSQAVELLAAEGLLSRTPDTTDRRVVHLALTEAALPLAREAVAIQRRCGEQLLSGLTPQEQAQFWSLLEKLLDNGAALAEDVKA